MVTLLLFISIETNRLEHLDGYYSRKDCGDSMLEKIDEYYPDGIPTDIYVVCQPTTTIGTSDVPPLRGK